MKKPKQKCDTDLTQIEIDLGNHLKDRIYLALDDFRDTAEIGGVPVHKTTGIMTAVLLDAALTGMITLRLSLENIEAVINHRLHDALDRQLKRKEHKP